MARLFTKANADVISLASLPYLSTAISVSFWYKNTTNPAVQPNAFGAIQRGTNTSFNYIVYQNHALISMSYSKAVSTFVNSYFLLSPDNGVWHHACVSSNFSTDCQWYFDGVSQSVTVDAAAGTPQDVSTNQMLGSAAGANINLRNGSLADVTLWNVKLTAGEAIALSKGVRPCFIRPTALQGYWPLDGIQSLEPDLSGNARNGTLSGTAYANGPPMMMFTPRWPRNYDPVTVTTVPLSQTHFRFRTDTGAVDATPTWGDAEDAA